MDFRLRTRTVALLSLIFTYVFFCEYLPPFRKVHLPYDLDGFHYPLVDYAFQSLREGRFPQWDPTIYCGMSFVGNVQAALFYPPMWLLFVANIGRTHVSYQSLEDVTIAHVWLAFLLCYCWLRNKDLSQFASILGGGVFAYSGYLMLQLQHFGLVGSYAWIPLGLWGIDEAHNQRRWQPLWKLAAASAMCFLAGYTPTWFVFAVCAMFYALGYRSWKTIAGTATALGASMLLCLVQLLPALELTAFKLPEDRYGFGVRDPVFYASFLVPNFWNFAMNADFVPDREYLYLGAPALLGLLYLFSRRSLRGLGPIVALLAGTILFLTNAFGVVRPIVLQSAMLMQICRDWYFLGGLTVAAAALAAIGIDHYLKHKSSKARAWILWLSVATMFIWANRELAVWLMGGKEFAVGMQSLYDPPIMIGIAGLALYAIRSHRGTRRMYLSVALLLAVGVDYKVFGTSRRFNAAVGSGRSRDRATRFMPSMTKFSPSCGRIDSTGLRWTAIIHFPRIYAIPG